MLLTLIIALYIGQYIAWLSFYFLLSVFIVDLVSVPLILISLKIKQKVTPKIVTRKETVKLKAKIDFKIPVFKKINYELFLNNKSTNSKINIDTKTVGKQYVGVDFVVIKSFFGIFFIKYPLKKKRSNCLVLPISYKIVLDDLASNAKFNADFANTFQKGNGDFIGARQYIKGDALKHVNFKKSSALRKTIVNEFENEQSERYINIFIGKCKPINYSEVCEAAFAFCRLNSKCKVHFFNGTKFEFNEENEFNIKKTLAEFNFKSNRKSNLDEEFDFVILDEFLNFEIKTNENPYVYLTINAEKEQVCKQFNKEFVLLDKHNLNTI